MAANKRPYFVTHKGVRRLVEAASPAAAAHHVVAPELDELRPARASEVSQWYRSLFPIDVAGEQGKPLTGGVVLDIPKFLVQGTTAQVRPTFEAFHARAWLGTHGLGDKEMLGTLEIFDRMRARGTMELHDFRALRELCPPLIEAIASGQGVDLTEFAMADGESIDFQDVVTAIATAHHRSLWGNSADAQKPADVKGVTAA